MDILYGRNGGAAMGAVWLLDCTLRDGGYLNDWQFGTQGMRGVTSCLAAAGVEFVELGFLDARRAPTRGRSIQPTLSALCGEYAGVWQGNVQRVAMIDYGTLPLEAIPPQRGSGLDGIRVIFKKEQRRGALHFCEGLVALGYRVFVQAVSITAYGEEELHALCREVNRIAPFALSIVDTYGLLVPHTLLRIYELLDAWLDADVVIGFHGHDNGHLALANCVALLLTRGARDLLLDGTLLGMGKSAGNAPIELLAAYLNRFEGGRYEIAPLADAIERYIARYRDAYGYALPYFLGAATDTHPSYALHCLARGARAGEVYEHLLRLEGTARLSFDERYVLDSEVKG